MDACPPLEDIAAFIDGMLPPAERERMTAHLARCESCYEVFAGAVEFAGDTGGVVHPFPLGGRTPRKLLLAASIVLTAGVGFFAWQASRPPEITLAGVVDTVENQPKVADHLYKGDRPRGGGEMSDLLGDGPSFMTGVYLIDLRLSVEAGRFEDTRDLLQNLGTELQSIPWALDLGKLYEQEYLELRAGSDVRQLGPKLRQREAEVQEAFQGIFSFSFGLWAEAGRLSAITESPEFFERRNNRRFLSRLQKELSGEVDEAYQDIPGTLTEIERLWNRESLGSEEYGQLARHFLALIEIYDKLQEEESF
jgi:hypothetical protein